MSVAARASVAYRPGMWLLRSVLHQVLSSSCPTSGTRGASGRRGVGHMLPVASGAPPTAAVHDLGILHSLTHQRFVTFLVWPTLHRDVLLRFWC
jgi:hypothetical protein